MTNEQLEQSGPILTCRSCLTNLGRVNISKLHQPMTGDMFLPLFEGAPYPFQPNAKFEDLKCRLCKGKKGKNGLKPKERAMRFPYKLNVRESHKKSPIIELAVPESLERPEMMECGICGNKFATGIELQEHLHVGCSKTVFKCEFCGRDDFKLERTLKVHITKMHRRKIEIKDENNNY